MTECEVLLLALLKNHLEGKISDFSTRICTDSLLKLSRNHSVSGIVGSVLQKSDLLEGSAGEGFLFDLITSAYTFSLREMQMNRLMDQFNHLKIPRILFKGFVLRNYYPEKELRSFGDIDIIIKEDDREQVNRLMLKNGFVLQKKQPCFSTYKNDATNELYEIHTNVMTVDPISHVDFMGYFERNLWSHLIQTDSLTYSFTPEFHLIYLLAHMAQHVYSGGFGVRMVMDVAVLIKSSELTDYAFIKEECEKLSLLEFLNAVLILCERWFDVSPPFAVHPMKEELYDALCGYILTSGTFGHESNKIGVAKLQQEMKEPVSNRFLRLRTLLRYAFPPRSMMVKHHPYLSSHAWLLPVSWISRFARTLTGRRKATVKTVGHIITCGEKAKAQLELWDSLNFSNHQ